MNHWSNHMIVLLLNKRPNLWSALIPLLLFTGCPATHTITPPDVQRFEKYVLSQALRDSLKAGRLTPGMPYFVAEQLFAQWDEKEKKIPVASVGSTQELLNREGWDRIFVDPNVQVYMLNVNTGRNKITLWFRNPTYYAMNVSARDTLFLFSKGDTTSSLIASLQSSILLKAVDSLPGFSRKDTLYGEIHFTENTQTDLSASYWYMLQVLRDSRTVRVLPVSFEFYPIERIELDGKLVSSYHWKEMP
jgi:hypothetical protein